MSVDELFQADRFIPRTEIKEKFDISEEQLRRMEKRPDWPRAVLIGRRKKYLGADLRQWMEANRV